MSQARQARRFQARPLQETSRPQPVDSWTRDLTVVLFAIALLLLIAGVALLLNPPVAS